MRFHMVTLGCPKNEVDSEGIEVLLTEAGHSPAERSEEADLVIVNTCGFIDAATEESVGALRRLVGRKRPGSFVVAAGCLAQREGAALLEKVEGVDAVLGCRNWPDVLRLVNELSSRQNGEIASPPVYLDSELQLGAVRRKARPGSAYVKISDGCDASCAFCAIPSIKGPYRSKPLEAVLEEVRQLADGGAREVVLVGQDSTAYGLDRGERDGLARLLKEIARAVPGLPWIRVLYLYPQRITPELLRTMADLPQVCKYVDIPLQHTHPAVLERMRRPKGDVRALVDTLRKSVPGVAIRTTFIVGFPGETAAEHHHLLRSIEDLKLDHIGVFVYSPQRGTPAAAMVDQVPDHLKQKRWRQAMEAAQGVSLKLNRRLVGRELDVLVEGAGAEGEGSAAMTAGRSYRDAPEVDGLVLFSGRSQVGEIARVRITGALEYDLIGEIVANKGVAE
ncbi:MAG TPA: 30S ribosomal protein S12 methylthiotransferase RimO [Chloroflexota bacterium]